MDKKKNKFNKAYKMIPKNENPLIEEEKEYKKIKDIRYNDNFLHPGLDSEKVKQWQEAFDENRKQRNEDFQKAYRATLCDCGYDKVKCKIKEVKCDK